MPEAAGAVPKTAAIDGESDMEQAPLLNTSRGGDAKSASPKKAAKSSSKRDVGTGSALTEGSRTRGSVFQSVQLQFSTTPPLVIALGAVLLLLIFAAACVGFSTTGVPPAPALPPTTQYPLGDFVVTISDVPTTTPYLRVTHREHAGSPANAVFESLVGVPVVSAMIPNDKIHGGYRYGHFHIEQHDDDICDTATFQTITRRGKELLIHGVLGQSRASWFATQASLCPKIHFTMTLAVVPRESRQLDLKMELSSPSSHGPLKHKRSVLTVARERDEAVYGFGTQYNILDARGHRMPILCREQGIGRGDEPLSWALNTFYHGAGGGHYESLSCVPHMVTSLSRGLFLFNTAYVVFDLTKPNTVTVEVTDPSIHGRIIAAPDPLAYLTEVTKLTGRMKPLPDWSHKGAIVSLQGGRDRILEKVDSMLNHEVQLAGIWVQDWSGRRQQSIMGNVYDRVWWNWEVDRTWYQDWDGLIDVLESKGVEMMTYINPFLADPAEDMNANKRWNHMYYKEAWDAGYLLKEVGNKQEPFIIEQGPGVTAALMDFDNPDAVDFYKTIIRDNMIKRRQKGWMGDFGEYYPLVGDIARGRAHNHYPFQWAQVQRDIVDATPGGDDVVFFSRSASPRSPGESKLFWVGDQMMSFSPNDGFPSAIMALITSGLSGHTLTHSDTGGYNSIYVPFIMNYQRTPELLQRWTEASVFSAFLRTHEGNIPKGNSQAYDEDCVRFFAEGSKLFKSLFNYRKVLMKEAYEKGWPLVRFMWLHFPNDAAVKNMGDQYMFGPDLLVKPVMKEGAQQTIVYLPRGTWMDVWTQISYTSVGKAYTFDSPLGRPPVFVQSGDYSHSEALVPFLKLACQISPVCEHILEYKPARGRASRGIQFKRFV